MFIHLELIINLVVVVHIMYKEVIHIMYKEVLHIIIRRLVDYHYHQLILLEIVLIISH
jgi:hypothetical protein